MKEELLKLSLKYGNLKKKYLEDKKMRHKKIQSKYFENLKFFKKICDNLMLQDMIIMYDEDNKYEYIRSFNKIQVSSIKKENVRWIIVTPENMKLINDNMEEIYRQLKIVITNVV